MSRPALRQRPCTDRRCAPRCDRRAFPFPRPTRAIRSARISRAPRIARKLRLGALATARCDRRRLRAEPIDGLHHLVEPLTRRRLRADDRRAPLSVGIVVKAEQRLDFGHGPIGAVAVGLVHDEHVGNLHHARLQRLHLVAHAGHEHENRDIGGAGDVDFVLPHADGLDRDDVFSGGVEHERRVGRRARQTAEMPARRHAADEHAGVLRVRLHAHAIAKHRAAAERAGGIDGEHADCAAGLAPPRDEAIDQRALAGAGRAGDADEKRAPRSPEQLAHERGPLIDVVLDERDAARDAARIAGEDRICESGQPAEFIMDDGPAEAGHLRHNEGLVQCDAYEDAPCRSRAHADRGDAVDRSRRCDRISRPQFGRRRSIGRRAVSPPASACSSSASSSSTPTPRKT